MSAEAAAKHRKQRMANTVLFAPEHEAKGKYDVYRSRQTLSPATNPGDFILSSTISNFACSLSAKLPKGHSAIASGNPLRL